MDIVLIMRHARGENFTFVDQIAGIDIRSEVNQFVELGPGGEGSIGDHVDVRDVVRGDVVSVVVLIISEDRDVDVNRRITGGETL